MIMSCVGGNADLARELPDVIACQPTIESVADAIRTAVETRRASANWGERNRVAYEAMFTAGGRNRTKLGRVCFVPAREGPTFGSVIADMDNPTSPLRLRSLTTKALPQSSTASPTMRISLELIFERKRVLRSEERLRLGKVTMAEDETQAFFDGEANGWSRRFAAEESFAMRLDRFRVALADRLPAGAEVLDFQSPFRRHHPASRQLPDVRHDWMRYFPGNDRSGGATSGRDGSRLADPTEFPCASSLPFVASSFDAVVTSSVLEYVYDCERVMAEFVRILRPGGWLFATVPDMRHKVRRREQWVRRAATAPLLSFVLGLTPWRSRLRRLAITVNFLEA